MGTIPAGVDPQYDEMIENVTGTLGHTGKPDPIDVRVIDAPHEEPGRTLTTFSQVIPADGTPVRVVPEIRSRRSLVLQLGAAAPAVVIGGSPALSAGTGFLLTSTPLRINATSAVWACVVTPGAPSSVTALAELAEG